MSTTATLLKGVAPEFLLCEERDVRTPAAWIEGEDCIAVTRCQNDSRPPRQLRELVCQIDSIAVRKPDVDEHRLRPRLEGRRQPLGCVGRGPRRLDSQLDQDPGRERQEARVVIDDQHRTIHVVMMAPVRAG
jgi:hypothetical protein